MPIDTSYMYKPGATTTGVENITSSSTKGKSDLNMTDFLQLMVEQMKNQDVNNSMDTSQYINQLSQYTMIQAVTEMSTAVKNGFANLQEMTQSTYSMSMIGKEATIAEEDTTSETGGLKTTTGIIEGVTFYKGSPMVIINGEQYELTKIMGLSEAKSGTATQLAQAAINAANAAALAANSATNSANSNINMANTVMEMVNSVSTNNEKEEEKPATIVPNTPSTATPTTTTVSQDATNLAAENAAAQKLAEEN